jgi:hypothetical protein
MGPYRKEYDRGNDMWMVYGNSSDQDAEPVLDDLLAECQTEGIADLVIEGLEQQGRTDTPTPPLGATF